MENVRFGVLAWGVGLLLPLLPNHLYSQTADWRFGFEYIEIEPPFATEAQHDTLMARLAYAAAPQQKLGAINVNEIGGGWNGMQPNENAAINFTNTDSWVRRLQRNGFELVFNLTPNAPWSQVGNTACIDGFGNDECAPDPAHEPHWRNYIKALVERYDGDGTNDMPGLKIPVRFYVMMQEAYFGGDGKGDQGEAQGNGYWEDNMVNLIRLHRITWEAMREADPTGQTKLVGSGGLFFDLYSDFPDYPAVDGPTTQARLNGANLGKSIYRHSFDSTIFLMQQLGSDVGGVKCDYIGWHPHFGWQATDQSLKFVRTYAPNKPIFIDDMWSSVLTDVLPHDGFTQFIGGDSANRDLPNSTVSSFAQLRDKLNAKDPAATAWYNAKTARDAVKCFATTFGEGAERAMFSLSNDFQSTHPLYFFSQPWRYTGIVGDKASNYAPKPVLHTMRMLIEKLHDFTSVERIPVGTSQHTRCYKFQRKRGTPCLVLWSEATPVTDNPGTPNGEEVTLAIAADSVVITNIVSTLEQVTPNVTTHPVANHQFGVRLGFEPIIMEEKAAGSSSVGQQESEGKWGLRCFPNPASHALTVAATLPRPAEITLQLWNVHGQLVRQQRVGWNQRGEHQWKMELAGLPSGSYHVTLQGQQGDASVVVAVVGE